MTPVAIRVVWRVSCFVRDEARFEKKLIEIVADALSTGNRPPAHIGAERVNYRSIESEHSGPNQPRAEITIYAIRNPELDAQKDAVAAKISEAVSALDLIEHHNARDGNTCHVWVVPLDAGFASY